MNVGEILPSTDPPEDRTKQPIPAGWFHMRFEGESGANMTGKILQRW